MSQHLTKLGRQLKELKAEAKKLKDAQTKVNIAIDQLQEKFVEAMQLHNIQNFKVKDLGLFYLQPDIYPKISNQEQLFADLRERGAEDLIKETVYPSTLRAFVKECIEQKNEIPQGIEVYPRTTVHVRKT